LWRGKIVEKLKENVGWQK